MSHGSFFFVIAIGIAGLVRASASDSGSTQVVIQASGVIFILLWFSFRGDV